MALNFYLVFILTFITSTIVSLKHYYTILHYVYKPGSPSVYRYF